ncbi:MAG: NAD-dependent epimerase/dehydratase family protein [Proteobacteria bacterium]|nr:NAD-dependent epimerase/dehydratase family protein [Pseudomonadota bacterium]
MTDRIEPHSATATGPLLVTGGAGFLGGALLRELVRADPVLAPSEIRVFDRRPAQHTRVKSFQGDIRSYEDVRSACDGAEVVLHAASLVDWGRASERELEDINVTGTQNVLRACRESGVRALVYTSTMDVVYGGRPIRDADERLPYPARFNDGYARTKAAAEQAVLAADATGALRTCAVRPCGMFGEADPYHLPNTLEAVASGQLRFRIGDGRAVFQHVYVGNVAHAHLLAAAKLLEPEPRVAGEIYLITDIPACNFFAFMEPILERLGHPLPPAHRTLPYPLVYAVAAAVEAFARAARPFTAWRPTLTRSSVRIVCQDLSFRGDKARRDLGYAPRYSEAEAVDRTVEHFRPHAAASGS